MKFSLLLVVFLFAFAVAENAEQSEEGIFDKIKIPSIIKKGLKELGKEVVKTVVKKAKDMFTDGLQIRPTAEVRSALEENPSSEGIFDHTIGLLVKTAEKLSTEGTPSEEGIYENYGYFPNIVVAERLLNVTYNRTIQDDHETSQEGIFGSLGGLVVKGLGKLVGGKAGSIISTAGDVLGTIFFAAPSAVSTESAELPSQEGIFSGAARAILKGAGRFAGQLIKGGFDAMGGFSGILGNIFIARGNFNNYASISAPVRDIFSDARQQMQVYNHPNAQSCFEAVEYNFTHLYKHYIREGHNCIVSAEQPAKKLLAQVEEIVLNSVQTVEAAHHETALCFQIEDNNERLACLGKHLPAQIQQHHLKVREYGQHMGNYVREFTDINTNFDVCLVGHLGYVRREVYNVVDDFLHCATQTEHQVSQLPADV